MTVNQIRYVLEISKVSSMREAAGRLFISQPALTASIAELENELGIILFDRTNKGVSLTADGREFVIYAKKALRQYEVLEDKFLNTNKGKERFSVSAQHYNFAVNAFTKLVNEYNPDRYVFSFHETRTDEVLSGVRDMRSEIGIISYSESNKRLLEKILKNYHLEFVPLMKRETYAYMWENHPLAGEKQLSLQQLQEYPCVSFSQGEKEDYYLNEEALSDKDFRKMIKSDDRATTMEIIAGTRGYSIGSGMLSGETAILKGLVAVKLQEEDTLTIGYILRKNAKLSEYASRYVDFIEEYRELEA